MEIPKKVAFLEITWMYMFINTDISFITVPGPSCTISSPFEAKKWTENDFCNSYLFAIESLSLFYLCSTTQNHPFKFCVLHGWYDDTINDTIDDTIESIKVSVSNIIIFFLSIFYNFSSY